MTAVNVLTLGDSVHLFTDTRAAAGGLFVANVAKVFPIPHLACAIATRGAQAALDLFARIAMDRVKGFDELRTDLARNMKMFSRFKWPTERELEIWKAPLEVFVIGWSKDGPAAFSIFNHGNHGFPAFEIVEIPFVCLTPTISPLTVDWLASSPDPVGLMPEIMAQQREAHPDVIGGYIQHTLVLREGIQTRVMGEIRKRQTPAEVRLPEAFARHLVAVDT